MNLRNSTATVASLVVLTTACSSATTARTPSSAPRIRFAIHIPDQVVASGRDPFQNAGRPLELTFKNESDHPLLVCTVARMAPAIVGGLTELQVRIHGPSGDVPYRCMDKGTRPGPGDYRVLEPGQTLSLKSDKLWCYTDLFAKPGTYTAEALYHDKNPEAPPPPPGAERVDEELIAEPVQFQVIAK
jgi:hypothetical protein